mmetsp:Transcript_14948/g.37915  ORF Transcript_14948/g.37915 Transcript_14948/m.37915 type:complete len:234 (-) Transcript_14948:40-741(-)
MVEGSQGGARRTCQEESRNPEHIAATTLIGEPYSHLNGLLCFDGIDLIYDCLHIKAICQRIGSVAAIGQSLHQACMFIRGVPNLLQAAVCGVEPCVQQAIQSTIAERIAIFPQQVVRSFAEVLAQRVEQLLPRHGGQAHVHYHRLVRVALVRGQPRCLSDPIDAERILHILDHNGGVVRAHARHTWTERGGCHLNCLTRVVKRLEDGRFAALRLLQHPWLCAHHCCAHLAALS